MISILSLHNITHRPAAVLGGGPSLYKDLGTLGKLQTQDGRPPVLISVNQHALEYVWTPYLVFMDEPGRSRRMSQLMNIYQGIKVSPLEEYSNVDLSETAWWRGNFSSHLATWLACWLGCNPVLLCGMNCYQNPRPAEADPRDQAYHMPLKEHLAGWRQAFEKCAHPERIRAVSGPLVEIFGQWK